MHTGTLLGDLAIVMAVSAATILLFQRLKQPVVLGYILAGIIIGPYTPPFQLIRDDVSIHTLSELGIVFLLFSLGLEFRLGKLAKVGSTAFLTAASEIVLMFWMGREIGRAFGWSTMDSLFLGAILSISSTTIIVKALEEQGRKSHLASQLIVGTLIVEDILAIAMLALLSGLAAHGAADPGHAAWTVTKLAVFLVTALVAGILVVPRLVDRIADRATEETLLVSVLGISLGFCLLVESLGYSVALGAFVIGAIIGESRHIHTIERLVLPLRDMFSAIFFVSIGLMINPATLSQYWFPILVITLAVVVGKAISCSAGAFVSGRDGRTSLLVGMGLSQIGEFSFLIAALGHSTGVTSDFLYPVTVAVAALTTFTTPYQIRISDPLTQWISKRVPASVAKTAALYTEWLSGVGDRSSGPVAAILRRLVLHLVVNASIVVAVFLGMAWTAKKFWLGEDPSSIALASTWSAAVLIALPFLVAIYRKARALGRVLAELSVGIPDGRVGPERVRRVLAEIVPLASLGGLVLLVSALSSGMLPPIGLAVMVFVIAIILAVVLWKRFASLHARLQVALQETMQQPPL